MDNVNKEALTVHLFKLRGDISTYIIGRISKDFQKVIEIRNPVFIKINDVIGTIDVAPLNMGWLVPKEGSLVANSLSVTISKSDFMYVLQQDFIPKEILQQYIDIKFY